MKPKIAIKKISLFDEIRNFIEEGKQHLSFVANATITYTYWRIGNRINQEILKNQRAAYGKKIVVSLSRQLIRRYGVSYEEKNLRRMVQFALLYRNDKIVVSLTRQLSWSHIITILPIKNEVQREFYTQMAIVRQKRMIIDGEDHHLDLLFFHRKLKRLVAIDLKLGKFKASYKGQMELYLRWLEKHEMDADEDPPIGLIHCSEGNNEQIELLQLEKSGIKVARYFTELPDLNLIKKKLHQSMIEKHKKI